MTIEKFVSFVLHHAYVHNKDSYYPVVYSAIVGVGSKVKVFFIGMV